MPGIVHELALLMGALVQPLQHPVEVQGQICNVIHAFADIDPAGQVILADDLGGLPEFAQGPKKASRNKPTNNRRDRQRRGGHQRIRPHGGKDPFTFIAAVLADQQKGSRGSAGLLDGHHQHADRPVRGKGCQHIPAWICECCGRADHVLGDQDNAV